MFYMHNVGWGWEFLMVIGMALLWALVLYAVIGLMRGTGARPNESAPRGPAATPLEILDRRLAQGATSRSRSTRPGVTPWSITRSPARAPARPHAAGACGALARVSSARSTPHPAGAPLTGSVIAPTGSRSSLILRNSRADRAF